MIYLASPYTPRPEGISDDAYKALVRDRVHKASVWTAAAWKLGHTVFSPIVHSHQLVEADPELRDAAFDHDFWMPHDLNLLEAAEEMWVLMLPQWSESKGIRMEINHWNNTLGRDGISYYRFEDRPRPRGDRGPCPENTIPWMGGCLDTADIIWATQTGGSR